MSRETVELFYLDGAAVPCGAVVTSVGEREVTCRVQFSTPDGARQGGAVLIRTEGSVTAWTDFTFTADGRTTTGSRDATGVTVGHERAAHDGADGADGVVVPSYGLSALVLEVAAGSRAGTDLLLLEESAGSPDAVRPATLARAGREDVVSPVRGVVPACDRVELTVDGRRTNTYWVSGGVVVASDWAGARSFALPPEAAAALRTGLGRGDEPGLTPPSSR